MPAYIPVSDTNDELQWIWIDVMPDSGIHTNIPLSVIDEINPRQALLDYLHCRFLNEYIPTSTFAFAPHIVNSTVGNEWTEMTIEMPCHIPVTDANGDLWWENRLKTKTITIKTPSGVLDSDNREVALEDFVMEDFECSATYLGLMPQSPNIWVDDGNCRDGGVFMFQNEWGMSFW